MLSPPACMRLSSARLPFICLIWALAVGSLSSLTSCQAETPVTKASQEGILLVGNGDEPKSFDPHKATGVIESNVLIALFEGLVGIDPEDDLGTLPGVALSWSSEDNFSKWTFQLRKDAQWSDGEPLDASDFVYSYQRMLHPDTAAPYAAMLSDFIKGAEEYNSGELKDFSQVGVHAPDPHTLVITCKEPVPYLPQLTQHMTWYPVPEHVVERYGGISEPFNAWSDAENIVGNGPFRMTEHRFQAWIEVEKNPHYWDEANNALSGIRFFPIDNLDTELRSFLSGGLHLTYSLPPQSIELMKERHPEQTRQETYLGNSFLRLNMTHEALSDPRVREAMALAINRQAIVDNISIGHQIAQSFTPPMGEYSGGDHVDYDPKRAQALLAEAGFPMGQGLGRLEILIGSASNRPLAESVQRMWAEVLGLQIGIRELDWSSYLSAMKELDYDIAAGGWIGDYPDPTTFLNMWKSEGGNNRTGWASPEFEALLEQAAFAPTKEQRFQLLAEAEAIFMDRAPVVMLSWRSTNYMMSEHVKGWYPMLQRNQPWHRLRLEP